MQLMVMFIHIHTLYKHVLAVVGVLKLYVRVWFSIRILNFSQMLLLKRTYIRTLVCLLHTLLSSYSTSVLVYWISARLIVSHAITVLLEHFVVYRYTSIWLAS